MEIKLRTYSTIFLTDSCFLAHLGTFIPFYKSANSLDVHLNKWNEVQFLAPEGGHKCYIQLQKWLKDPTLPFEKICCFGQWDPKLNHLTTEGRLTITKMGGQNNYLNEVMIRESFCDMISQFIEVSSFLKYIIFKLYSDKDTFGK